MADPLSGALVEHCSLENGSDTQTQASLSLSHDELAPVSPGKAHGLDAAALDPAVSPSTASMQRPATALSPLASEPSSPIPIAGAASPPFPATPASHGPPDPLDAAELDALMQKASPVLSAAPRFSIAHITRNLEFHKAARRELDGSQDPTASQGSGPRNASVAGSEASSCLDGLGHEAEIERQRAAIRAIDEDIAAESRVNRDMAGLVVERMEDSRRALEGLLRLITAMAAAEHAYSGAMASAAVKLHAAAGPNTSNGAATTNTSTTNSTHGSSDQRTSSSGSTTTPSQRSGGFSNRPGSSNSGNEALRPVAQALLPLPKALAEAHGQLEHRLRGLGDGVRQLQEEYQQCCKDISSTATALHRGIDAGRHSLGKAFQEHKSVCEAFDLAAAERPRSRAFIRSPDQDPWATEGKLVQEHKALQGWQDRERDFLKGAFSKAEALETRRLQLTRSAVESMGVAYSSVLQQLPDRIGGTTSAPAAEAAAAAAAGGGGGGSGMLLGEAAEAGLAGLRHVAAEAARTAEALAARQAESIEGVCQELFCSPEIIRQGEMSHWNARSSAWTSCHFVLTRAGFLHWFASMEEVHALDLLNLAKCQFEAGEAPIFNIVEGGSNSWLAMRSGRRATFKASTIEECCEWAIALREAIALASSRHQRSSHAGSMNGR